LDILGEMEKGIGNVSSFAEYTREVSLALQHFPSFIAYLELLEMLNCYQYEIGYDLNYRNYLVELK